MLMKYSTFWRFLLSTWIIILLPGCSPTSTPPVPDTNRENVLHEPSEISFPFQVDIFTRIDAEISSDESLISTNYFFTRANDVITMRVRVYPKPERSLQEEMEILKKMLLSVEKDPECRFIAAYDISKSQGDTVYLGHRAFFRIRDDAFANIYIFNYGDWYVEYHTIFPRDLEREAEAFVNDFSWSSESSAEAE